MPVKAPKNQKRPQNWVKIKCKNWKKQRKRKLFNYMSKPQKNFRAKNSPLGLQKVKNDPKIQSKSNVRIERNIINESCPTTWIDPITVFEPYPNPKNSPSGPKKSQNDPKIKTKSNHRIEGNIENESYSTTWVEPKTVDEPYSNPKNIPLGLRKVKKDPKIK